MPPNVTTARNPSILHARVILMRQKDRTPIHRTRVSGLEPGPVRGMTFASSGIIHAIIKLIGTRDLGEECEKKKQTAISASGSTSFRWVSPGMMQGSRVNSNFNFRFACRLTNECERLPAISSIYSRTTVIGQCWTKRRITYQTDVQFHKMGESLIIGQYIFFICRK